ncbi:MAG: hypothetical protein QXU98_09755 [Candidatus Parvarchaeota archaeon]
MVVVIIAIFSLVAIPSWISFIKSMAFTKYTSYLSILSSRAKIVAAQRNTNVSLCVVNPYTVDIEDLGHSQNVSVCSGSILENAVSIDSQDQSYIKILGTGFSFNPRGYTISTGYICIERLDNNQYYMVCANMFGGLQTFQGSGLCPANCQS